MPLYKRPGTKIWWVRIGRHTRRSTGTTDRAKAEEFEQALTERLWRQHKLGDRGAASWNDVTQRWLKGSRRPRTRDRWFLEWLKDEIGEHSVQAVAHPDVFDQLRDMGLEEGWSHSTVDRMMRTVRAVLRFARDKQLLAEVPKVEMYGEDDPEPRFLTPEEFAALCRELPKHLQLAARFAVCTLLRKDDQARLTWDRIDLERKTMWVKVRKTGKYIGIALSPQACAVLDEVKLLKLPGTRIFGQAELRTKAWDKACTRAGVPGTRWHDLRHTGASWAVQSGVTLLELMALGGWKSYRSVLRYAALAPANTLAAANSVGLNVAQALKLPSAKKP